MAKNEKSEMEESIPGKVENPEVKLVEEEQLAPVSIVDDDTEEIPIPLQLVEEPQAVVPAPDSFSSPPVNVVKNEANPGALKWLFDPISARGRFMRGFTRWAAIVIGLFALGFLVAHFALYQPVAQQLESSREESASLMAQLKAAQEQVDTLKGDLRVTEDLLLQAQSGQTETQTQLKELDVKRKVLEILYDVTAARMAVMTNDRVVALALLVSAGEMLDQIRPDIEAKDAKLADFVNEQLQSTLADLKNSAPSTPNGLEKLHRTVQSLERLFEVLSQ